MNNIYLFLLLCIVSPLMAQVAPSQVFNDTRTFEVSACSPSKGKLISAWMEKRPVRKDNSSEAVNMQVAYKSSVNNGKSWTEKAIIDMPNTFATGNPFVANNEKGDCYLVCMHIGNNFYSGNISLYAFDFKEKKFNLKSVPVKSENRLLDKPSIVCSGHDIHLVYVSYEAVQRGFKNAVKYQMSKDKGQTWTDPVTVFRDSTIRYLGPSITILKGNQVAVAAGSYGRKDIYFAKRKMNTMAFESPVSVSKVSAKLGSAMTEMFNDGKRLMLTWQCPHQRSETYLSFSTDGGMTWADPLMLNTSGNLLSSVFDKKGNIHCIYADFNNQHFYIGYKVLNAQYEVLKEEKLTLPASYTFNEYLGAYQKLLIHQKELFAFWIDYPGNSTLKFTRFKI